jgi:CRISPR-associated protein Csd2
MAAIKNRYEFVMLYDVENGNPNGDPDAGNMPRIDPETGHGIVTDVCIKRKIRNYVDMVKDGAYGYDIYIKQDEPLNNKDANGVEKVKSVKTQEERDKGFRDYMCERYFDIRTFGAVLTTAGKKGSDVKLRNIAGQVRGPVQLAFGKSIEPIYPAHISITRMAVSKEEDFYGKQAEGSNKEIVAKSNTMGDKWAIPYALYRQEGFISANLAQKVTGFSDDDLELLCTAIINMFEFDRSAARGKMVLRELIVFKHDNELGCAPAHKLFETVTVKRNNPELPARSYSDYQVVINESAIPEGVICTRMV